METRNKKAEPTTTLPFLWLFVFSGKNQNIKLAS
jgi:hypothetical protein